MALAMAAIYFCGARLGLMFTPDGAPTALLWPPNALLLAGFLLSPPPMWRWLVAGALPAHLVAELQGGVPVPMVLSWFLTNVAEALIGAAVVRRLSSSEGRSRHFARLTALCIAAVVAPFVASFLDIALVRLNGWGQDGFWAMWRTRFFANVLSVLTFVPVALAVSRIDPVGLARAGARRWIEGTALLVVLVTITLVWFGSTDPPLGASPSMLYLPIPVLLWAAVRFGSSLTSFCFTLVSILVLWGAEHGRGPFQQVGSTEGALPIQLFLIFVALPVLLLAALHEERAHALGALRASQQLFSTAFMSSPVGLAISRHRDGEVLVANDRWLRFLGYDGAAEGASAQPRLDAHLDGEHRQRLAEAGAHRRDVELTLRSRDGSVRQVLASVTSIMLDGEPCTLNALHDVTALRRAESENHEQRQQLAHLTRVASLTDFSSTIAHELNQPLTAILSNAQAAQRFLSREPMEIDEVRQILVEITEADKRAGRLINHMRDLMRKGGPVFAPVDLNRLVEEALHLVRGEFVAREIQLSCRLGPDVPPVSGDPVQLQQLVLNLASNACEAMDRGSADKHLTVETRAGHDGCAQLIVGDTGPGIAPDQLERVFEPFHTTKEGGLGLGLSICRSIARAHGGALHAEAGPTIGTLFRLTLPALLDRERPMA